MPDDTRKLLWKADELKAQERATTQRLNPNSHLLRNPFAEDLVYLMGGEAVPLDVLDYPTLGKRFLLHYAGGPPDFYELGEPSKPFGLADPPSQR